MKIWNNTFFYGAEFTKVRTDKTYYGRRTVIHCAGIHLAECKSVPEFLSNGLMSMLIIHVSQASFLSFRPDPSNRL
jgi:hypothetical protein